MPHDQPLFVKPSDGPSAGASVTKMRGGVRVKGMVTVLTVSTLVAIVAVVGIWLFMDRPGSNGGQPGSHAASKPDAVSTADWRLAHLGPDSVQKCNTYRLLLAQTERLQAAGGGVTSPADQTHLAAALADANATPPVSVTALQCGVPL